MNLHLTTCHHQAFNFQHVHPLPSYPFHFIVSSISSDIPSFALIDNDLSFHMFCNATLPFHFVAASIPLDIPTFALINTDFTFHMLCSAPTILLPFSIHCDLLHPSWFHFLACPLSVAWKTLLPPFLTHSDLHSTLFTHLAAYFCSHSFLFFSLCKLRKIPLILLTVLHKGSGWCGEGGEEIVHTIFILFT